MTVIKSKLKDFYKFYNEIEAISGTIDNLTANKILLQDAAPKTGVLVSAITKTINLKAKQAATPERKALLGMMADAKYFNVLYINPDSEKTLKFIERYLPTPADLIRG